MEDDFDDVFMLHAQTFLAKFQAIIERFRRSSANITELEQCLDKSWPQILQAFTWTTSNRANDSMAANICDAFMACGSSDSLINHHRSPEDFSRWGQAAKRFMLKLDNPNHVAFVGRFAAIATMESEKMEIVESTRRDLKALLSNIVEIKTRDD